MKISLAQHLQYWALVVVMICTLQRVASADPIPVRYMEGTEHGFLVLRTKEGRIPAVGDLFQVVRGDRVTSRLLFRFRDGSVDHETAVFSQRGHFRLMTDHHIQKGPSFRHPMELAIDVRRNQVTVRSAGKDGKDELTTDHLDLPPDLSNGMILSFMKSIRPDAPETKVSMVVAAPKPRLVKLAISPRGEEPSHWPALPVKLCTMR